MHKNPLGVTSAALEKDYQWRERVRQRINQYNAEHHGLPPLRKGGVRNQAQRNWIFLIRKGAKKRHEEAWLRGLALQHKHIYTHPDRTLRVRAQAEARVAIYRVIKRTLLPALEEELRRARGLVLELLRTQAQQVEQSRQDRDRRYRRVVAKLSLEKYWIEHSATLTGLPLHICGYCNSIPLPAIASGSRSGTSGRPSRRTRQHLRRVRA